MVTSIGLDADGVLVVGELAPDAGLAVAGALAPPGDDAGEAPDAADGLDAAAGPDADDAPPDVADGSELELPPLHPPMIAAIAIAITPTDKCPFICASPIQEGPAPVQWRLLSAAA
ncbi:hypothetical protein [Caballeronia glebae]|uniref:hypothetical protein n=1 Tax=Caballeronia glebae TaxID=1777143 RepID=UPI0038B96D4F